MADYAYTPVIRLPKSKVDRHPDQVEDTLVSETLYLKSFPSTIYEADLRQLLQLYQPLEIQLYRQTGEGYLRFRNPSIADQVYALYQDYQFPNGTKLHFSVHQDSHHEAESMLLKVAHLPRYTENTMVYRLFRPFGPLALCKLLLEQDDSVFRGTALIQYFYHEDSEAAIQAMHGYVVEGNKIVVESFISSDHHYQKSSPSSSSSMTADKSSEPGYVDLMNLYIKNLDPIVTNNDLFNAFRAFGRIVSARVMSNQANNQSKGYGFVSFSRPEDARMALEKMNGKMFFSKPLVVSYHAPKKPRQTTPLPQVSATHDYPSSPYHDSCQHQQQQQQQQQHHNSDMTPPSNTSMTTATTATSHSTINGLGIDNVEQIAIDIKDLSIGQNHSSIPSYPIQRKLSIADNYMTMQQARMSPPFSSSPISGSTAGGHSLASLASGLSVQQAPSTHQHHHHHHHQHQQQHGNVPILTTMSGSSSPPPTSLFPDGGANRMTKGYKQTAAGRPTLRRKSSLESISTVMTESSANLQRQRLTQAVLQCEVPFDNQSLVSDIVDMLLTLKKKERSLCLFNQDFLKAKIQLALEALETFHDEDDSGQEDEEEKILQKLLPRQPAKKKSTLSPSPAVTSTGAVHATTITSPVAVHGQPDRHYQQQQRQHQDEPQQYNDIPKAIPARVSKAIPIVAPPPSAAAPATSPLTSPSNSKKPAIVTTTTSTSTLATNGLSGENKALIDSLMKSMEGKPIHEKKQLLGDNLFPLVKATGTKQAPKVTIELLDSVDLLELATMMFDKAALKKQVDIAFAELKRQQQQQQQQQQQ